MSKNTKKDRTELPTLEELSRQLKASAKDKGSSPSLFLVQAANTWIMQAKLQPIPKMLFAEFWHEGELCILFADTNLGKSILAVQVGNSISKGFPIPGFPMQAKKQMVLYFDFELNAKQFEHRYSLEFKDHYFFDDFFQRAEIDPNCDLPKQFNDDFEAYITHSLEQEVIRTKAKVLIIDNLTYLRNETEKARSAMPLMKELKRLKSKYSLSILALAHTPKRDLSKPITRNDLQGSKMLINFCDSSFAIGESNLDKNIRYLKQIKERQTEKIYHSENVIICQVIKPRNFLQFEFLNFGKERDHLKEHSEKDRETLIQNVLDLNKQGRSSLREIGKQLGISHSTVKYLFRNSKKSSTSNDSCPPSCPLFKITMPN